MLGCSRNGRTYISVIVKCMEKSLMCSISVTKQNDFYECFINLNYKLKMEHLIYMHNNTALYLLKHFSS